MSTVMPRSALRHRPIQPDIHEWVIASPRATKSHRLSSIIALVAQARQFHPLSMIGASMLTTFLLLWAMQGIWHWSNMQLDTLRYSYPRTSQVDHVVGHGGVSHFIATNQQGQVYVLEIPGGDPTSSHLFVGPHLLGSDADLAPITLFFQGDPHRPDLIIEVQSIEMRFQNTGKTYVPTTP